MRFLTIRLSGTRRNNQSGPDAAGGCRTTSRSWSTSFGQPRTSGPRPRRSWLLPTTPHLPRPLVHRKLLSNIVDELVGLSVANHERDDPPEIVIGQSDDGGLRHAFVPEQRGLHFTGADAVPAGLDQVGGLAANDAMHAAGIDRGDVTGAIPAVVGEHGRGGVGPTEVSGRTASVLEPQGGQWFPRRVGLLRRRRPAGC